LKSRNNTLMKQFAAALVLLFLVCSVKLYAQNLIGYNAKDIRLYMKENQKGFSNQRLIYNNTFKYLKYIDRKETQTLLFFLSADSVCKSVRLVCDKILKAEKTKELDSNYKKSAENTWTEIKNGKKFIIELKDEEWSFSINIRPGE